MLRALLTRGAQANKFGSGKHGFTAGNPANGTPATSPGPEFFDSVQEEIANVIESVSLTLDPNDRAQLLKAIEQKINGAQTINCAGGQSITLNATQAARKILVLTGALTANINMIFPNSTGSWIVRNQTTGAFSVTCKTAAGTGVVVSQNTSNALWGDGTNIYAEQSDWANLALTGTPTAPTPIPGTDTTQIATMAAVQQAVSSKASRATTLEGYGITNAVSTGMASASTFNESRVTESGFAMVTISAGNAAQSPTNSAGQFFVISVGNSLLTGAKTQLAIDRGDGRMYLRFINGGEWSGWTRIAAAATTLAGYGITDAVALGAFVGVNQSLGASGYQKLPGGLIIQWGQLASANGTVTFPIAFPNNCVSVACTADSGNSYIAYAKSLTPTNFFATAAYPGIGAGAATNYRWLAIGY